MNIVGGEIAQYGLTRWWMTLTDRERTLLLTNYNPTYVGTFGGHVLIEGRLGKQSHDTPAGFLMTLASWLHKTEADEKALAVNIADLAWEMRDVTEPVKKSRLVLAQHFALGRMCDFFYTLRDDTAYTGRWLQCAQLQIEMEGKARAAFKRESGGLPEHHGYKRMAIVLEKERRYDEALNVIREARRKGWAGDWDKREQRIVERLSKTK